MAEVPAAANGLVVGAEGESMDTSVIALSGGWANGLLFGCLFEENALVVDEAAVPNALPPGALLLANALKGEAVGAELVAALLKGLGLAPSCEGWPNGLGAGCEGWPNGEGVPNGLGLAPRLDGWPKPVPRENAF